MSKLLIVYCSMTGHTKAAAEAIAQGAKAAGAKVTLKTAGEATAQDLIDCDAVALGSYDAFSYMGGGLKDFFDRTYYPTQNAVAGKPYAAFLTHGGGGKAVPSIQSIAASFKLKEAVAPVLVQGQPDAGAVKALTKLGATLAGVGKK
jgi:flavorubredoxin